MTHVAITGASGNLGEKLTAHLSAHEQIAKVTALDLKSPSVEQRDRLQERGDPAKVEFVTCDLTDWSDRRWRDVVEACDAVVHFAAKNPYPEATWDDANTSLDMTLYLALAALEAGVGRFVFASSNHVMGRYKDEPLAGMVGPGELTTDLEHGVGTQWHTGTQAMDSTVYAVAKSSGERICDALATTSGGQTTFVCLRIGWCQPGENRPETLSAAGTPTQSTGTRADEELDATEQWFRNMWLSNRDFDQLCERAVLADAADWPEPCVVVNGMSANTGMKWSLEEARRFLGYEPRDDSSQARG